MAQITDFAAAKILITQNYAALLAALPSKVDQINAIVGSAVPPEQVSEFFEFCYANRAELPAPILVAAADVGNFAWVNGFWGLGIDGRGSKMETVLRGKDLPKGVDAPAPSGKYGANDAEMPGAAG